MAPPAESRPSAALVWALRAVWVAQVAVFIPLLSSATSTNSGQGRVAMAVVCWATWTAALLASLTPSTVSLTVGRLIAPVGVVVAAVAGFVGPGAPGWNVAGALAAAALGVLVWFSGDIGIAFAQGSAYGDERRFPLGVPAASVPPMVVTWLILASVSVGGAALLVNEQWLTGGILTATAATLGWFLAPRFHLMARRWLVIVPAGIVVHDPLLLTENALFRTRAVSAVRLAPNSTEAADLTGVVPGVAIEIVLCEADTVVVRAPDKPRGSALHVLGVLVAPTRPGKALAAASARRLPVG